MKPAIFIDRDGTVSHEVGYLNHPSRFRLFPWTVDAVRHINRAGWLAVLVTNQAGVARGYFPEAMVHEVHDQLRAALESGGARLDAIYYCPHRPEEDCECRKPKPGMLLRAARELEIDLNRSFMIGDRYVDVRAAHAAGVRSVLVCTGDGAGEMAKYAGLPGPQPNFVADNLQHAVDAILSGQVK